MGLAALTGNDVWKLDDSEAKAAASAIKNVARHYPTLAGHEKLVDWVMLLQTIGVMYGTRIYLTMPQKPEKKAAPVQQNNEPSPIMTFPFAGGK